jgi:uncharacterized membrane-anchored protein
MMSAMTPSRRNMWIAIVAVALAQAAVLGWMIWQRAQLLSTGREIVLEVIPVDPRSLFQGDYVALGYDISRVPITEGAPPIGRGSVIYVTLQKTGERWHQLTSSTTRPENLAPDQVFIKGRVEYASTPTSAAPGQASVHYGIEDFFVPEGAGRELEKLVGQKKIDALIAVDAAGNAGIKGLVADGKRVYEEPLL